MQYDLTQKLGLWIKKKNVKARKIDKSYLNTFGIVIIRFIAKNKLKKIRFFDEIL